MKVVYMLKLSTRSKLSTCTNITIGVNGQDDFVYINIFFFVMSQFISYYHYKNFKKWTKFADVAKVGQNQLQTKISKKIIHKTIWEDVVMKLRLA